MNERIQELACEAEDYADGIVDQGGEFHQAYTQRLAELIVQECMNVVSKKCASPTAYYALRDHFGVEE